MKLLSSLALVLLPITASLAQPAPVTVQSALLGVPLPAGASISRNGLYRAAARADLKLEATPAGLTLGEPLELIRLPLDAPPQAALVSVLEGAGWSYAPRTPTWGVATKGDASLLVSFSDSKRERWIYVAQVAGVTPNAGSAPAASVTPSSTDTANGPEIPATPDRGAPVQTAPSTQRRKPADTPADTPAVTPAVTPPVTPNVATSGSRYHFTSTNFDDGWVAVDMPEFVKVTKGPITAYLFHRVRMTDEMRPPVTRVNDYFWARDVTPRFDVKSVDRRERDLAYSQVEYLEGEATERSTGKPAYVAINVHRSSGGALDIVVVAPDKASFRQLYPKPEDLESLLAYNRFAVAPSDLVGEWSESSSAVAEMYYTTTGNYAGMNVASLSSQFFIAADGTYRSKHAGATGMVGNARVFQQEYHGRYTMRGDWEATFTDRFNGKAEAFGVHFEAVTGGRILHLTNLQSTGIQYHLGRVH